MIIASTLMVKEDERMSRKEMAGGALSSIGLTSKLASDEMSSNEMLGFQIKPKSLIIYLNINTLF